jgi:hypothetical protein
MTTDHTAETSPHIISSHHLLTSSPHIILTSSPHIILTSSPHIISSHHRLIISSSHLQEHFGCFECARTFADGGAGGAPLKAYSFESNPYCEEHYRSRIAKQV